MGHIGVSGAGKTALSRFVARINGLSVFQIKVHKHSTNGHSYSPSQKSSESCAVWPHLFVEGPHLFATRPRSFIQITPTSLQRLMRGSNALSEYVQGLDESAGLSAFSYVCMRKHLVSTYEDWTLLAFKFRTAPHSVNLYAPGLLYRLRVRVRVIEGDEYTMLMTLCRSASFVCLYSSPFLFHSLL